MGAFFLLAPGRARRRVIHQIMCHMREMHKTGVDVATSPQSAPISVGRQRNDIPGTWYAL